MFRAQDLVTFHRAMCDGTHDHPVAGFRAFEIVERPCSVYSQITFDAHTTGIGVARIMELAVRWPRIGGTDRPVVFLRLIGAGSAKALSTAEVCRKAHLHLIPESDFNEPVYTFFEALLSAAGTQRAAIHWRSTECPDDPIGDVVMLAAQPRENNKITTVIVPKVGLMEVRDRVLRVTVNGTVISTTKGFLGLVFPAPVPA